MASVLLSEALPYVAVAGFFTCAAALGLLTKCAKCTKCASSGSRDGCGIRMRSNATVDLERGEGEGGGSAANFVSKGRYLEPGQTYGNMPLPPPISPDSCGIYPPARAVLLAL